MQTLLTPQPTALTCVPGQANPGLRHIFWKDPPPRASLCMAPAGRQKHPLRLRRSPSSPQAGMLSTACVPLFLLFPFLQPCTDSPASAHSACMAQRSPGRGAELWIWPVRTPAASLPRTLGASWAGTAGLGRMTLAAAFWGGMLHRAFPYMVPHGWHVGTGK